MRIATFSFWCLITFSSLFSQVEEAYFESGALKSSIPINQAGVYEGTGYTYYPNGQIAAETPYVAGIRQGIEKEYFQDGTLKSQCSYERDVQHGWFIGYYPNGKMQIQQRWVWGRKEGALRVYYMDGKIRMYGLLEADSLLFAQRFNLSGKLMSERLSYLSNPIDTARMEAPKVFFYEGNALLRNRPNPVQIFIPQIPTAYISFASTDGEIRSSNHENYPIEILPQTSKNFLVLYLRIKTHASARPSILRKLNIPVDK